MFFGNAPDALVGPIHERVMQSLHARDVWRGGAEKCWQDLGTLLDALDARAPEEGYWIGRSLTVADLAIFAMVHSLRAPLTPPQAEEVGRRKRLVRYLDRIDKQTRGPTKARPASAELSAG
jgi:glutathione S-transferase